MLRRLFEIDNAALMKRPSELPAFLRIKMADWGVHVVQLFDSKQFCLQTILPSIFLFYYADA